MSLAFKLVLLKGRNLRLGFFSNYMLHTLLEIEFLKHYYKKITIYWQIQIDG